jgi:hypothetical protein
MLGARDVDVSQCIIYGGSNGAFCKEEYKLMIQHGVSEAKISSDELVAALKVAFSNGWIKEFSEMIDFHTEEGTLSDEQYDELTRLLN